jgi:hypothetical protein
MITMSQTPEERSGQPATAVERAEELISRAEKSISAFPALIGRRAQLVTNGIRERGKQAGMIQGEKPNQPENVQTTEPGQPENTQTTQGQPAMEKADKIVDDMGQRLSLIAAVASLQTQKITARVRENAEDMWAEIQQIRHERGAKSR